MKGLQPMPKIPPLKVNGEIEKRVAAALYGAEHFDPDDGHPLSVFLGLRNAVLLLAATVGCIYGVRALIQWWASA